jgi:hypothetical protein
MATLVLSTRNLSGSAIDVHPPTVMNAGVLMDLMPVPIPSGEAAAGMFINLPDVDELEVVYEPSIPAMPIEVSLRIRVWIKYGKVQALQTESTNPVQFPIEGKYLENVENTPGMFAVFVAVG